MIALEADAHELRRRYFTTSRTGYGSRLLRAGGVPVRFRLTSFADRQSLGNYIIAGVEMRRDAPPHSEAYNMWANHRTALTQQPHRECRGGYLVAFLAIATLHATPVVAQRQANVPCGLVSWWPLDGTAADIQGGNTGAVVTTSGAGAGAFVPAMVGTGWKSTEGSLVIIRNNASLDVSKFGGFTIDFWIRIGQINDRNMIIVWKGVQSTDVTSPYYVSVRGTNASDGPGAPGTIYFSISDGTKAQFVASNVSLPTNIFKHVTVTSDRKNLAIYVDGILALDHLAAQQVQPGASAANLQIGGSGVPANFFDGIIDEVELFDRALDPVPQSEIMAIYRAGSAGKCRQRRP